MESALKEIVKEKLELIMKEELQSFIRSDDLIDFNFD